MNSQHLYYLHQVIDLGSMAAAADRLGITQPTLSRIVKVIEENTGAPILKRGRYGVTPTELGARLGQLGREIAQQVIRADEAVAHWNMGLQGEIRLGVGPMLAISVMGEFLRQMFDQEWPYAIHVDAGYASRLVPALGKGHIDGAIIPTKLSAETEHFVQVPLFEDRLAIYSGPTHALANSPRALSPNDLQQEFWIETATTSGLFNNTPDLLDQLGISYQTPKLKFSGDFLMCAHVVSQTNSLCILPETLVSRAQISTPLHKIAIDFQLPRRDVAFWTTKDKIDRPEVQHLIERLLTYVNEQDLGSLQSTRV